MKIFSKLILAALVLSSGSAFAQQNKGKGNDTRKTVIIRDTKTNGNVNGVINANEHASASGQAHANTNSVLNGTTTVTTKTHHKKPKKHYRKHRTIRKIN